PYHKSKSQSAMPAARHRERILMTDLNSLRMRRMLYPSWTAQAVYAAARLDIADAVTEENGDIDQLAKRLEVNPEALYRLMRALAGEGIFREEGPRKFVMTPLAECLRTD